MKNLTNIVGYLTAFSVMITITFKFNHLEGAAWVLTFSGLLLSIYFPLFILNKMSEASDGKTQASHVTGAACAALLTLAILFKILHWYGASIMLLTSLGGFSFVFLPLLFIKRARLDPANRIMNLAGACGLGSFALGLLFKIQHWPGAAELLIASPALLFLVYFPMYMMKPNIPIDRQTHYLRNAFTTIIVGSVLVFFIYRIAIELNKPKPEVTESTRNE